MYFCCLFLYTVQYKRKCFSSSIHCSEQNKQVIFLKYGKCLTPRDRIGQECWGPCILPRYYIYLCPTRPTFNPAVHEMFIDALARI